MPQEQECKNCGRHFIPPINKPGYINECGCHLPPPIDPPERKPLNPLKEGSKEERSLRRKWLKKGHPLSRINALLHGD